jgi:SAM-dependent MidA family methyltransferase
VLRAEQAKRVPDATWHESLDALPDAPILLVANEFFDALPVRQWVGEEERRVAGEDGTLMFTLDGPIREDSPVREAAASRIAAHLAQHGGVGLIIDYGHAQTSEGDTLQAVRGHGFADVLTDPGEQDLTAHVDFEALARAAAGEGIAATPVVSQGEWLDRLGIEARATALADAHPARAIEISTALRRLTAAEQMGSLFKVMAVHSAAWPRPAGWA